MDPVQRRRLGERLRGLRGERGWHQRDLATRAHVSTGTIQGIESGGRETKDSTLEKVCAVFGSSVEQLVRDQGVQPSDPLLQDLNREDLRIARAYNRATSPVRDRVRVLLSRRDDLGEIDAQLLTDAELIALARTLADLDAEHRRILGELVRCFTPRPPK